MAGRRWRKVRAARCAQVGADAQHRVVRGHVVTPHRDSADELVVGRMHRDTLLHVIRARRGRGGRVEERHLRPRRVGRKPPLHVRRCGDLIALEGGRLEGGRNRAGPDVDAVLHRPCGRRRSRLERHCQAQLLRPSLCWPAQLCCASQRSDGRAGFIGAGVRNIEGDASKSPYTYMYSRSSESSSEYRSRSRRRSEGAAGMCRRGGCYRQHSRAGVLRTQARLWRESGCDRLIDAAAVGPRSAPWLSQISYRR